MNHGTMTGYKKGCRCEECREANREYARHYADANRGPNVSTIPVRAMHPMDFYKPEWVADAACRGMTDLFFAERGDTVSIRRAKELCAGCKVRQDCLKYGLNEQYGIWGGIAPKERRSLRPPPKVAECGTNGGYYRHRRALREEPCDACKAAHTAVTIAYNRGERRSREWKQEAS